MNKPVLEAKKLSKTFLYPEKHTILKEISLTIYRGETLAITGPSGVGKSTLLHILGTLDVPDSGELLIANNNALKGSPSMIRNTHLGFVFQNFNLLDQYTLLENILLPARIKRKPIDLKRAQKLLKHVNLYHRAHHLAKQLSGGEKQRASVARALCNSPDLILADEPSGNLDTQNSQLIHELLIHTAKELNTALIVVTHNQELANLCDRRYTLNDAHLTST